MNKYNLTTLVCCFYPSDAALERALAREVRAGTFTDAQVFDLALPVRTGVVTRFRSNIHALHAAQGMDVAAHDGTMPGFLVMFYRHGTTMKILADQGVVWDELPESERDEALRVVKRQREAHMEALDEEHGELHVFRSV